MTETNSRDEIAATLAEYCRAVDDGRFDDLAELFEEDAVLRVAEQVRRGRDALVEEIAGRQSPGRRGKHMTSNLMLHIDGARAVAESDFAFFAVGRDGTVAPPILGRYLDELACDEAGRWRFRRRDITFVGTTP